MRLMRWLMLGGLAGTAYYWLMRYLRPEHSPLVLNNSVVLLTGASSGIGRAYANAFARRGARLALAARRAELLEAVRLEVEPYAADVLVVPTDVTDDRQLEALVEATLERYGQIDILINNAGVVEFGPFHAHTTEKIRQIVNTNLASALCLTRLALPSMLARRSGRIINVASMAGKIASPIQPVYSSTKFGLVAFSNVLRRQLHGTGIEVISVLPAFTDTEMNSPKAQETLRDYGIMVDTAEFVAERTIDGILKGDHEIYFGGLLFRAGAWLEQHFPLVQTAVLRAVITPEILAAFDTTAKVRVPEPDQK